MQPNHKQYLRVAGRVMGERRQGWEHRWLDGGIAKDCGQVVVELLACDAKHSLVRWQKADSMQTAYLM